MEEIEFWLLFISQPYEYTMQLPDIAVLATGRLVKIDRSRGTFAFLEWDSALFSLRV